MLETERDNEGARRFYTRHGFTSEDSLWMSIDLR
jgi:ribosomal protein S18 acetylase RimI-like enzyme